MPYDYTSKVRSFNDGKSFLDFEHEKLAEIKRKIESKDKEYILNVNIDEYINAFVEEYSLTPLKVNFDQENKRQQPVRKERIENVWRELCTIDVYYVDVIYPYTGSRVLFELHPSSYTLTSNDIYVSDSEVYFTIRMERMDVDEFSREIISNRKSAFTNIENINRNAESFNAILKSKVTTIVNNCIKKYEKEDAFFKAIVFS